MHESGFKGMGRSRWSRDEDDYESLVDDLDKRFGGDEDYRRKRDRYTQAYGDEAGMAVAMLSHAIHQSTGRDPELRFQSIKDRDPKGVEPIEFQMAEPKPQMDASRVMSALLKHPRLLWDVAERMGATRVAILGPWTPLEQQQPSPDRVRWTRRLDPTGKCPVMVREIYDHRDVLAVTDWAVYLKGAEPGKHYAKGEAETVKEAQDEADAAAREAGWMLV